MIFYVVFLAKRQKKEKIFIFSFFSGPDETRTRDPMRDRHVF